MTMSGSPALHLAKARAHGPAPAMMVVAAARGANFGPPLSEVGAPTLVFPIAVTCGLRPRCSADLLRHWRRWLRWGGRCLGRDRFGLGIAHAAQIGQSPPAGKRALLGCFGRCGPQHRVGRSPAPCLLHRFIARAWAMCTRSGWPGAATRPAAVRQPQRDRPEFRQDPDGRGGHGECGRRLPARPGDHADDGNRGDFRVLACAGSTAAARR